MRLHLYLTLLLTVTSPVALVAETPRSTEVMPQLLQHCLNFTDDLYQQASNANEGDARDIRHYALLLEPNCLELAFEICQPNETLCIDTAIGWMDQEAERVISEIPDEIAASQFQQTLHERRIDRLRAGESLHGECIRPPGSRERFCEIYEAMFHLNYARMTSRIAAKYGAADGEN